MPTNNNTVGGIAPTTTTDTGGSTSVIAGDIMNEGGTSFDNYLATVNDYKKMGTSYVQNMTNQILQQGFAEQQIMMETQNLYGISGPVAAAQAQQLQVATQQNIISAQQQAAMEGGQQTSAVQSDMSIYFDQKNMGMAESILKRVADDDFSESDGETMMRTFGSDYDGEKLGSFANLTQQEARDMGEMLTFSNEFDETTAEE